MKKPLLLAMSNETIKAIYERRSCRNYKQEQITDEELKTVLEAGTYAPTGKNLQDPVIIAVQNERLKAKIIKLNAEIMGSKGDPFYGAPTLVLVFGHPVWKNYIQDGSLVLGTMMLAAHSIGLGSCWINREIEMFQTAEGKALMKEMGVADDLGGIGALALGYWNTEQPKAKPRKEDYYRIIK